MTVFWILAAFAFIISGICIIGTIKRRKEKNMIVDEISYSKEEKREKIIRLYSRTIKSHQVFLFFNTIKIILSLVIYFVFYPQWILLILAAVLIIAVVEVVEDIYYMKSIITSVLDKERYYEWLATPKY